MERRREEDLDLRKSVLSPEENDQRLEASDLDPEVDGPVLME